MAETTAGPIIREPTVADVDAIAEVHVAAWQVGYHGLLPAQMLDAMSVERSAERWRVDLLAEERTSTTLVADLDNRICAISSFGPYREVEGQVSPEGTSELWMLNAHPDAWGTGVAQVLIAAAIDGLRSDYPATTAALWVLESNARGRRFYEKEGWSADGRTKVDTFAGQDVTELRYTRPL